MTRRWPTLLPNALAFLSSCWIMVIELVASRLVARYIGSSVYTWTAVIGVILAGISLGNHIGGRLADRHAPRALVGWLFVIASLMVLLALVIHPTLGSGLSDLEFLPWSVRIVLVVTGIFFLPAVALGTISPVAAKMALAANEEAGRTIGNVYAWGALGSITGTFLTGFWLIGLMGTINILATSAGMLGLIGLAMLGVGDRAKGGIPAGKAAMLLLGLGTIAPWPLPGRVEALNQSALERERKYSGLPITYVRDSDYYHLVVRADRAENNAPRATLVLDNLIHGFWVPRYPEALEYEYERLYARLSEELFLEFGTTDKRGLFLGGGAYTFPRYVQSRWPRVECVVSEIDQAVLDANHAAMGLAVDTPIESRIGDARSELRDEPPGSYTIIYGDAFHDFAVPWHLTTVEFTSHLFDLLESDGLYLMNIIDFYDPADLGEARFAGALYRTCTEVFGEGSVALWACLGAVGASPGTPVRTTYVLACAKGSRARRLLSLQPARESSGDAGSPFWALRMPADACAELALRSPLLTDDYAPVEQLLAKVAASRG